MFCDKCGKEVAENSIFCNYCGNRLNSKIIEQKEDSIKYTAKNFNNKLLVGIISFVALTIVILSMFVNSSPIKELMDKYYNNDYDSMHSVYVEEIKGDPEKEKELASSLLPEIKKIMKAFDNEEITYDFAYEKVNEVSKLNLLKSEISLAKSKLKELNTSRKSYSAAYDFEKNDDYYNAINEYKKVIEDDAKNYSQALIKIDDLTQKYKQQVIDQIDNLIKEIQYKEAVSLTRDALRALPNDKELLDRNSEASRLLEEQLAVEREENREKAINEQLVTVEKTGIIVQSVEHKILYPDMYEVRIKNNTEETIKSYKVSMLGWDKNGYPLKIKSSFLDNKGNYEFLGSADNVNVIGGSSYGKGRGWELEEDHSISITKAVVFEVEFYDGSSWDNPYYKYFLEDYEGKPIEE